MAVRESVNTINVCVSECVCVCVRECVCVSQAPLSLISSESLYHTMQSIANRPLFTQLL